MDNIHMGSEPKSHGALIGSIIIVIILIIGAVYYYKSAKMHMVEDQTRAAEFQAQADKDVAALKMQGSSDDVSSIEADLKATDVDNMSVQ